MSRYAKDSPEAAMEAHVQGLPTEWLECQISGRHRLPQVTDPRATQFKRQRNGTFLQVAHCEWCGTKVTKVVAATGFLDEIEGHPEYIHPKGYLRPASAKGVSAKEGNAMKRREGRVRNQEAARAYARAARKAARQAAPQSPKPGE